MLQQNNIEQNIIQGPIYSLALHNDMDTIWEMPPYMILSLCEHHKVPLTIFMV